MVLQSPQWGGFHPFVADFEKNFAHYQHAKQGISAFNGTVTLELALTVLGIGEGDEVIVPAISFISTATAVSRVGATPVFVDIEPHSFNIDPAAVAEAIGPKTKGVVAVHFGGALCDMDRLSTLCQAENLLLLEDAAHAHGSEWNGRRAGSFGICGSFSFQNGKVLSAGEGGLLVTSDEGFAEEARSVANQGRLHGKNFFEHYRLGTNFRLTGWQAAVLVAQMERLDEQIERRTARLALLKSAAATGDEIIWQAVPSAVTRNSQYLALGRVRGGRSVRDLLCERLRDAGVPNHPFYPHTLPQNPLYAEQTNCRVLPCPNAEACVQDAFWLPHRVLLADEGTVEQVGKVMRSALAEQPHCEATYR
jgi:dTDP-4-amino-4,6-dideoxygalactose transaminase